LNQKIIVQDWQSIQFLRSCKSKGAGNELKDKKVYY
jgi:hypothetical protein